MSTLENDSEVTPKKAVPQANEYDHMPKLQHTRGDMRKYGDDQED